MSKHPVTEKLFLEGPVGRLEAILERPGEGALAGAAVVCHPHPQHGGTMHNKVAHTLARAFVRSGFEVLRFNFRGTEQSEGHYDNGVGELDDALAAIEYMRARHGSYPLWLAGFSFGGYVQTRVAQRVAPERMVLVGTATGDLGERKYETPPVPAGTLVIHGEVDETVPLARVLDWARPQELPIIVIPGADHFFHRRLHILRNIVKGTWH